jgi:hypothetical protein
VEEQAAQLHMLTGWEQLVEVGTDSDSRTRGRFLLFTTRHDCSNMTSLQDTLFGFSSGLVR